MIELPLKDDATKAAIDFLEEQGYSVIKWVDFDQDDENTWPDTEYTDQFITNVGCLAFNNRQWLTLDIDSCYTNRPAAGVTYWACLPQPKENLHVNS